MSKVCVKYNNSTETYVIKAKGKGKIYVTRYEFLKNPSAIKDAIKTLESDKELKNA